MSGMATATLSRAHPHHLSPPAMASSADREDIALEPAIAGAQSTLSFGPHVSPTDRDFFPLPKSPNGAPVTNVLPIAISYPAPATRDRPGSPASSHGQHAPLSVSSTYDLESASASGSEASSEEEPHTRLRDYPPIKPSTSLAANEKMRTVRPQIVPQRRMEHFREAAYHQGGSGPGSGTGSDQSDHSGIMSVQSSVDEIQVLWTKLDQKRRDIRERRQNMAEKRGEIKEIQQKLAEADNSFMKLLRPLLLENGTTSRSGTTTLAHDEIQERFQELQSVRDEYSAATSEYEALEADVDREEGEVTILEAQFFSSMYAARAGSDSQGDDSGASESVPEEPPPSRPPSRLSLLGISGTIEEDIHPLYRSLLDAVGECDLAQEHYSDLVTHRRAILYDLDIKLKLERLKKTQKAVGDGVAVLTEDELEGIKSTVAGVPAHASTAELKRTFGSKITKTDLLFLESYGREEEAAKARLDRTTEEARRIKALCVSKGAMRQHAPEHEEYTIFMATGDESTPPPTSFTIQDHVFASKARGLAHPEFSILLSDPSHVLEKHTAKSALRMATRMPKEDPGRPAKIEHAMKEFGISNLLSEAKAGDKSDYINRWLLQNLRISPREVHVLLSVWPSFLKIINMRRWQEDVLYHWTRDELAELPASVFDGLRTLDDDSDLDIDEETTASVNSENNSQSQALGGG